LPRLARDDRNYLPLPVVHPERAAITGETGLLHAIEAALAARGRSRSVKKPRTDHGCGRALLKAPTVGPAGECFGLLRCRPAPTSEFATDVIVITSLFTMVN
jgi:hypothetical protein